MSDQLSAPGTDTGYTASETGVIGGDTPLTGRIELLDYDPAWPELYAVESAEVREVLGDRVLRLEHVGSTSVPGLAAKPVIDMVLEVADASDEAAYVDDLLAAGYHLRVREPDWFEHRMLRGPGVLINLHVFSTGCPEIARMLTFRDRLRGHPDERELYERTKRELAARDWTYLQDYADAKSEVVAEIVDRATAAGS